MTALFLSVLVSSLLGSLHCAGMCGPLVAVYAGDDPSRGWRRLLAHALYSSGRLAAYATVGALAGALGEALDLAGSAVGVQRVTAIVAGLLIAAWGAFSLLRLGGADGARLPFPAWLQRSVARAMQRLKEKPPVVRATLLGLTSALLPCGWLYIFAVIAAGSGSVLGGTLVMAAFWLGTLPVMLAVGVSIQSLAGPLRRHVPALCAAAMVVVGLFAVFSRWDGLADATQLPAVPMSIEEAVERAGDAGEATRPCCAPHADSE